MHLVDRRAHHGEIEAVGAADVAVEHVADMEGEIHVGARQTLAAVRFSFNVAMPRRAATRRRSRPRDTHCSRPSPVKMASVPSPISFSTSPP